MKKSIITISRQSGSGGRSIAVKLAQKLGYECYDWEIIERIALETGYNVDYVAEHCENSQTSNPFLHAMNMVNYLQYGMRFSPNEEIAKTMRSVIEELASRGRCIFVGRCADYILSEREDTMNVFIYADDKYRADRIVNKYNENIDDVYKEIQERDKKRKIFYRNYTGREWGELANYDILLDGGALGENMCAEIIAMAVKNSL